MKELAHGTLFAVPLPDGTFLSGRVMLDIYGCLKRRLFPDDSPLPGLGKAYLVEMYHALSSRAEYVPSDVMIRGAFLESDQIGVSWPIIGKKRVDPHEVELPESIIGYMHKDGAVAFECGELRIPLSFDHESMDRIGEFKRRHSAFLWPYTCLRLMGRGNEVPSDYKMATLEGGDLRYSRFRDLVYKDLPITQDQSYFEQQAQLGLHLERLYE